METAMSLERHDLEDRHWWFRGHRHAILELGRRLVPKGGAVVQVGCGTGGVIGAFPATFHRHGVDRSASAIAVARSRYPGVTFEVGSPPKVGAGAIAAADLVVVCGVVEHMYDDIAFLDGLLSGMRSGAQLLFIVPGDPRPGRPGERAEDIRRYTHESLARTCRGLPAIRRFLAPLNRRLYPVAGSIGAVGRWPVRDARTARVPWRPVNAALERLLVAEVPGLIAALRTSPRVVPGRGTSLVAVLERVTRFEGAEATSAA